jgi:hypothetical protein
VDEQAELWMEYFLPKTSDICLGKANVNLRSKIYGCGGELVVLSLRA